LTDVKRLRVVVSGRVQGVGYRYFAQAEAASRGLAGYVRNLQDGNVELVAEGPAERLDSLVITLRQGPELARVDGGEVTDQPAMHDPKERFRIRT
jgi:acylphosphatase